MDVSYERPMSTSSYFARSTPPIRLLLRINAAEGLQHLSSHGTYCKVYVGSSDMVHGSGVFARRSNKLAASTSSLGNLLSSSRIKAASRSTLAHSSASFSAGDSIDSRNKMRVLKTNVQKGKRTDPVWNEKFDIPVLNIDEDVLSIRVKSARLMSSLSIGACSIPLKHFVVQEATTIDRWFDLSVGKKDAGRIRLQLRIIDPSVSKMKDTNLTTLSIRQRNSQNSDTYLSLPVEESPREIAARTLKKMSRRDHKYHRFARHFDGRSVTSNSGGSSKGSSKSKHSDLKRALPLSSTGRDNSECATSNESIGDSESASDVSISPVASNPASTSETASFENSDTFRARESSLNTVYARDKSMRISELEQSKAQARKVSPLSLISRSSRVSSMSSSCGPEDDDDVDELDYGLAATTRWTGNPTKMSELSSSIDYRESSRMEFDDDSDDDGSMFIHESISTALPSTTTSTHEQHDSERFSFSDSEDEDDAELQSEKTREKQRQQWQMEQRQMQLSRVKEVSRMKSFEEDEDEEDESDCDELQGRERESSRMMLNPALAELLDRESTNILFEGEDIDDDDVGFEAYKLSEDFVPMLEPSSLRSVDSMDYAFRQSSFD
ncbi:hypothetical protein CCR75_002512 [Bremia lactucae]|uniref:C2 domain-containing protein n=1 Tax=Bremia lactucae TaxID=4779 RepID=A0A976NYK4_BRELC|nr:hypothetical protein CCR75_002512 [Bremia lactucae]